MKRYLLDTNTWIYVMRDRPPEVRARYARLKPGAVVMSSVVFGELQLGWRKSARPQANLSLLEQYMQGVTFDPLDADVARVYGRIRADLEARGQPIGANDLWIAAHALQRKYVLVTHDTAEFARVPDLHLEDWAAA